jgi:hypothetical protein
MGDGSTFPRSPSGNNEDTLFSNAGRQISMIRNKQASGLLVEYKKPDDEEENKEEQELRPEGRASRLLLFSAYWLLSLAQ